MRWAACVLFGVWLVLLRPTLEVRALAPHTCASAQLLGRVLLVTTAFYAASFGRCERLFLAVHLVLAAGAAAFCVTSLLEIYLVETSVAEHCEDHQGAAGTLAQVFDDLETGFRLCKEVQPEAVTITE